MRLAFEPQLVGTEVATALVGRSHEHIKLHRGTDIPLSLEAHGFYPTTGGRRAYKHLLGWVQAIDGELRTHATPREIDAIIGTEDGDPFAKRIATHMGIPYIVPDEDINGKYFSMLGDTRTGKTVENVVLIEGCRLQDDTFERARRLLPKYNIVAGLSVFDSELPPDTRMSEPTDVFFALTSFDIVCNAHPHRGWATYARKVKEEFIDAQRQLLQAAADPYFRQ